MRPIRILIVEDQAANRALLAAVFSRAEGVLRDVELTESADLASARRALSVGDFAAVILDIRLPDGSGLDLIRELADGAPARPRPKVIVMSASVLQADRDAAWTAGGDAFLAKPFRPAELTAELERLISASG
ncbi:MAG TPA: response regulator [Candidatus Limnocylindrales bacterium]|nr:response regulator [Candidatus Limnocylindrales bacterium]